MDYRHKTIKELKQDLIDEKTTSEELFKEASSLAHKYQDEYNSFVTIIDKYKKRAKNDSMINGIPYAIF